jgi:hypothetical protein
MSFFPDRPLIHSGDVIDYRPRVTGGTVTGVVTSVIGSGRSAAVTFRVTEGTSLYRTGTTESVFAEDVSHHGRR